MIMMLGLVIVVEVLLLLLVVGRRIIIGALLEVTIPAVALRSGHRLYGN